MQLINHVYINNNFVNNVLSAAVNAKRFFIFFREVIFQDMQKHAFGIKTNILINDVRGLVVCRVRYGQRRTSHFG
jgi:hypothetical protein